MSSMGTMKCKAAILGATGNCTINDEGVASFPIGAPTFTSDQSFPSLGSTTYSIESGVGITTNTTPSEGFSKLDSWLYTYLLDAPPYLGTVSSTVDVEYIQVSWSNPSQKKLGFMPGYAPAISAIKADVKLSTDSWSNAWTITLESPNTSTPTVTSLKIMLDYNGASNLTNGTYTFYAGIDAGKRIIKETAYDVRIYAVNDSVTSGAKSARYTIYTSLATLASGTPNSPTNLSSTSNAGTTVSYATWTQPTDPDINSDTSTPYITRYMLAITATSSSRYGGVLIDHTTPQYTAQTSGSNAATSLNLNALRPGTNYSMTVAARNSLNPTYGPASIATTFKTSDPIVPSWPSSTISFNTTYNYSTGANGYTLNGSVSIVNIFNYAAIVAGTVRSTTYSAFRTNYTVSDTSAVTGTIEAYAGDTGSESLASVNTVGFGYTNNSDVDTESVRCHTENDVDYYSSPSDGFWKVISAYVQAINPSTYYRSKDTSYSMYMKFNPVGGSTVTTSPLTFYVDELSETPTIQAAGIVDATVTDYITGVPTYTPSSTFSSMAVFKRLAYRFLRNDKNHFSHTIQTSGGTALGSTTTVTNNNIGTIYTAPSTGSYYNISTTPHNGSGTHLAVNHEDVQVQWTSSLSSSANNKFDEAIRLSVTAYNLYGTSAAFNKSGRVDVTDGTGNTAKPLRIDTNSIVEKNRYTGTSAGTIVDAGVGQFPSTGYTVALDHSVSILESEQLQLINGAWATVAQGNGYKDYSGFYFPGSLNQPDYSVISSSGYRYVCFKFSNISESTFSKIRIQFNNTGLTQTPISDSSNFRLYLRIDSVPYWLDCNKSIGGSGYGAITADGDGVMDYANTTLGSSYVYVPTASAPSSTIYVRIGLDQSVSQSISNVRVSVVS